MNQTIHLTNGEVLKLTDAESKNLAEDVIKHVNKFNDSYDAYTLYLDCYNCLNDYVSGKIADETSILIDDEHDFVDCHLYLKDYREFNVFVLDILSNIPIKTL